MNHHILFQFWLRRFNSHPPWPNLSTQNDRKWQESVIFLHYLRVSSWNNGTRCMSYYYLKQSILYYCQTCVQPYWVDLHKWSSLGPPPSHSNKGQLLTLSRQHLKLNIFMDIYCVNVGIIINKCCSKAFKCVWCSNSRDSQNNQGTNK